MPSRGRARTSARGSFQSSFASRSRAARPLRNAPSALSQRMRSSSPKPSSRARWVRPATTLARDDRTTARASSARPRRVEIDGQLRAPSAIADEGASTLPERDEQAQVREQALGRSVLRKRLLVASEALSAVPFPTRARHSASYDSVSRARLASSSNAASARTPSPSASAIRPSSSRQNNISTARASVTPARAPPGARGAPAASPRCRAASARLPRAAVGRYRSLHPSLESATARSRGTMASMGFASSSRCSFASNAPRSRVESRSRPSRTPTRRQTRPHGPPALGGAREPRARGPRAPAATRRR